MGNPKRIGFGELTPDVPPLANPGLVNAMNVVPIAGGYDPVGGLKALSSFGVLPAAPKGAIAGIDDEGNPFNFAGTEATLQRLSTTDGVEDVTRISGGAYNCSGECRWEFDIFGDLVIAVNPNDETQYIDVKDSFHTGEDFARLSEQAPRAAHIGTVGTFVVLGRTFDSVNGLGNDVIHWSAINNPFNWPTPGTDVAAALQSDRQPLEGNGGAVQRVVSGSEVAAIFQERAIWRADYRGGDIVFELNRVEPNRGLLISQIAIAFGRNVFYSSEDGFYLFDYTSSTPIGREKIDRTFLADVKTDHFHRISAVPDPNTQRIWIAYAGAGSEYNLADPGRPNKLLVYDWGINRFAMGDQAVEMLTQVVDAGLHLDSPDVPVTDPDEVDTAGLPSFDARIAGVGGRKLGAYSPTFQISDFTGQPPEATLETGRREIVPGRRSMVSGARLLVDSVDAQVQAAPVGKASEATEFLDPKSEVEANGEAPLRVDARYHAFKVTLPSGFSSAIGMDVYAQESGTR